MIRILNVFLVFSLTLVSFCLSVQANGPVVAPEVLAECAGCAGDPIDTALIFPQVANGSFSGGSFRTTLVVQNTGASAITARVEFFQDDGRPFNLAFTDGPSGTVRDVLLAAGGTAFLTTDGQGPLRTGWARLSSNTAVGGTAIFSLYDAANSLVTEAGVSAAAPSTAFSIPVDTRGAVKIGLALTNPGTDRVRVTIRLLDRFGRLLEGGDFPLDLDAAHHIAYFVHTCDLQGSLSVSASRPIAATGLRVGPSVLTALPILPGAFEGDITTGPRITNLSPTSVGGEGDPVTIHGSGFADPLTVQFDCITATVENLTPTSITTRVPPGALCNPRAGDCVRTSLVRVTVTVGDKQSNTRLGRLTRF